jgi:hypothetical protein
LSKSVVSIYDPSETIKHFFRLLSMLKLVLMLAGGGLMCIGGRKKQIFMRIVAAIIWII